jgi:hypothetical protein
MSVVVSKFPSILYLALVCSAVPGAAQTATPVQIPAAAQASKPAQGRTHKPSAAKKQEKATPAATPLQVTPQGPLQPITLGQMPALPPQVSYSGGKLTITAQNSTLGDILRAVRSQTAGSFDVPPNATERVVGRFGPGPAREVLVSLLNGSHFDYVMLGSATDPNAVAQLILTPKAGSSPNNAEPVEANQGANVPGQAPPYPRPMNPNVQAQIPQQMPSDGAGEGDNVPDNPEDNTEQAEQPEGDQEGAPQGLPQQPNGQPAVKTPQQLLQELQQQQLQQQQQQQGQQQQGQPGQNPPGQPPVVYPNPQVNQPPQ